VIPYNALNLEFADFETPCILENKTYQKKKTVNVLDLLYVAFFGMFLFLKFFIKFVIN
jgi:hypothetical protein